MVNASCNCVQEVLLTCMYRHPHSNCREGQSAEVGESIEEPEGVQIWQL